MRPGGGRAKGAAGERELILLLTGWGLEVEVPLALRRNLEQVRSGGFDLNGFEAFGLAVECKRVEALAVGSWWGQAVRQAGEGLVPVLAYRQSRKPWAFRVRAWVHPCPRPLDIDMDTFAFREWFQQTLLHRKPE